MSDIHDRTCFRSGPAFRRRACVLIGATICLAGAARVYAHPLGNDSITHFNVLYVLPDRVEVDYLVDIAENPAQFIETNEMDRDKDGKVARDEQETWLESKISSYAEYLSARINRTALKFSLVPEQIDPSTGRKTTTSKVIVPMAGPMGMTYRLVIRYVAHYPRPLGSGENLIDYEDKTYPQTRGLKLVLLEPISTLCQLYGLPMGCVQSGQVSADLKKALSDEALPLNDEQTARLSEGPATASNQRQWILIDGEQRLALVERPDCLAVIRVPYCEVLEPHPPFVSEDNAAFRYEQYDPMNLPDVRTAAIRFRVIDGAVVPVSLSGGIADADDSSQPEAKATAPAGTSSRPAADHLPEYANSFLDPTYNPVQTSGYQRQANKMIGLLQGQWGIALLLVVTGTAFAWGAAHALMPGHAKTVVAAYLISQRGTYWHAFVLAVIVTVTHTALVVMMGLVIWYFKETNPRLAPTLQLWLGLLAGVLVATMGLTLLWRAVSGRIAAHGHEHDHHHHDHANLPWWRKLFTHSHPHLPDHDHSHEHIHDHGHANAHAHAHEDDHAHGHGHHHHDHAHGHDRAHDHGHAQTHTHGSPAVRAENDQLTFRMLLVLGVTGGIVPCPSATIIMFLGIGANVIGGALYAIAIFSLGLALTLMLIGSLALASRRFAAKVMSDARSEHDLSGTGKRVLLQIIPALSGIAVSTLGGMIAFHYICLMRDVPSPFPWMG